MPVNTEIANEVWERYKWLRDNGHYRYVRKAAKCEDFFEGLQWSKEDLALMKAYKRPALTINKIMSTMSNVMGEQIFNRSDIAFRPRDNGATEEVADALTKVFMQISDNNHLPWVRSDVFCDGIITSRGFFDVRLDFSDNQRGEVRITQLNPKNVLVDGDADDYDPDKWNDVVVTKWMSPDEIEVLYSKKDAEILRKRPESMTPYGYDSIDQFGRDRFGDPVNNTYDSTPGANSRSVRVIERQYRKLDRVDHFVDLTNGDTRPVPSDWDREQITEYLDQNPDFTIQKKLIRRIRWTVVADNLVLHDDWSPYNHFTVVPFFPFFRRGRTLGLVENLIGPQELLNKTSSQELHIVNTSANSGWKVRSNSLKNMSVGELEQRGAQSGLVLELDAMDAAEKIQPNQVPTGVERISYKAEEHIKTISGVSDYMQGFAREDVSAKSVMANQQGGQANLAKVMDNMIRTDHMLARAVLDIVQEYYTEERLIHITTDKLMARTEQMVVNEITPEGAIARDLTLGEYSVVVTHQPERQLMEESQFEQAMRLRTEAGIPISDRRIIEASRLKDKVGLLEDMEESEQSQEAQEQRLLERRKQAAEVAELEANAKQKNTDAELRAAKAQKEIMAVQRDMIEMQNGGEIPGESQMEMFKVQQEYIFKRWEAEQNMEFERWKVQQELALQLQLEREKAQREAQLAARQNEEQRVASVMGGSTNEE